MVDSVKQVYYQDYKIAYSQEGEDKIKASDFGYIIQYKYIGSFFAGLVCPAILPPKRCLLSETSSLFL
jgi:hypothetical protein